MKVVVTGLGVTTPIGGDVPTYWSALLAGKSGIRTLTEDWVAELPVRIGGHVLVEPTE
ncbi:MAG: beta-ketoacyl synthase N-terminal-like domain-containing protein, partial [Nocardioidaceae bacterium]